MDLPIDANDAALRGRAVELFARLEVNLNSVLANYYTRHQPYSTFLHHDILWAEGFSYGLRRSAFEAIVRRHDWFEGKRMQHLHNAGRWRNFLAHVAGMETHDYSGDTEIPKIGFRDPKHPHPTLTVAEAFERFSQEVTPADEYVTEVFWKVDGMGELNYFGVPVEPAEE